jgi:predicted PurR-regulated permease PerM
MLLFILVLAAQVYAKYLLEEMTQPIQNTRYLPLTKLVCQISGVIACGLLLSILLPPIWWWIILCPCAFKSIRVLHGSYQKIYESLHDVYQQTSESLHDIYQRTSELLQEIYQQNSESIHSLQDKYQQIYELLHGISARVFNKLHDAFKWIYHSTQQAGPPRVQNV